MNKLNLEEMINENDTLVELSEECQFSIEGACTPGITPAGGGGWPLGGFLLISCY